MDLNYILNSLGEDHEEYFNAISPPIMQTSNFLLNTVEDLRNAFANEYDTFLYSRGHNPTVEILRKKLAALDGAEDCLVFNSGAAAIFCSVLSEVKSGDHIVSVKAPYTWARKMFEVMKKFKYRNGNDGCMQKKAIIFLLLSKQKFQGSHWWY